MDKKRKWVDRIARASLAAALAAGLTPHAAFATESGEAESGVRAEVLGQISDQARAATERAQAQGYFDGMYDLSLYDYVEGDTAASTRDAYPATFDLRDVGVVTPVKNQNPWGTCWGFAAISAAETSILSELGTTYEETPIDLSELQLAWFAATALPEGHASGQGGEGLHLVDEDPAVRLDIGGTSLMATSVFSSGIGPVTEQDVPYRNAEGNVYYDGSGEPRYYAKDGDWSVDESWRFVQELELEASRCLPSPVEYEVDPDTYEVSYVYNPAGTAAIKSELMEGRAVDISFTADVSRPGQTVDPEHHYINTETWAHYTYESAASNHSVTIVGWDDGYSRENFNAEHQPEGDGAWIVKNSWGAESEEFPNRGEWGVDGTGYFYLSYYDRSLLSPETFDFFTEADSKDGDHYIVDQHDFMVSGSMSRAITEEETRMANVFTAEVDQAVRTIAMQTGSPNAVVTAQVYLLDEDATGPTDGRLVETVSETFEYGGFHRIDLDVPVCVSAGRKYAVVVSQLNPDGEYETLVSSARNEKGSEFLIEAGLTNNYSVGIVNPGESYLFDGEEWTDWTECIEEISAEESPDGGTDYDNFPIKAYADPLVAGEFDDVSTDDWFFEPVSYVSARGIMNGYGETDLFGALDAMQRQDVAVMLYRYLAPQEHAQTSDPAVYGNTVDTTGLADLAGGGRYYTPAVNWAVENGYVIGYQAGEDAGQFGVGDPVSRQDFAVILSRIFAGRIEAPGVPSAPFLDADDVASYAQEAIAWCAAAGIVLGDDGGMLQPARFLSRAEAAAMMMRADRLW